MKTHASDHSPEATIGKRARRERERPSVVDDDILSGSSRGRGRGRGRARENRERTGDGERETPTTCVAGRYEFGHAPRSLAQAPTHARTHALTHPHTRGQT